MTSERTYAGVALGERRGIRRQALVDAALDCLVRDGLGGISVRGVCTQAGIGPRYFYENFKTLDELLVATVDDVGQYVADQAVIAVSSLNEGDLRDRARAAIDGVYQAITSDPRRANLILVSAAGHDVMQQRRQMLFMGYADLVVRYLVESEAFTAPPPDPVRAKMVALFMVSGAVELFTAVLLGSLPLTHEQLVDTTADLWAKVLEAL